jgi:hypothetical protein
MCLAVKSTALSIRAIGADVPVIPAGAAAPDTSLPTVAFPVRIRVDPTQLFATGQAVQLVVGEQELELTPGEESVAVSAVRA